MPPSDEKNSLSSSVREKFFPETTPNKLDRFEDGYTGEVTPVEVRQEDVVDGMVDDGEYEDLDNQEPPHYMMSSGNLELE